MRKILVICTGNSCRSIIAEALINHYIKDTKAYSAGSNPAEKVHPFAKKVLEKEGIWDNSFYSKSINEFLNEKFDMVITVCDNAQKNCPFFPNTTKIIHLNFEDPDGKPYSEFVKLLHEMKERLLKKLLK